MKKVLALIAVVVVVCAAGAAFAQPRMRDDVRSMPGQIQQEHRGEFGHRGGRLGFAPDMPEELRAKVVEAAKLRIDLEEVLSRRPVDKAKAMEIFAKVQQAENEVETWKFGNMLERMEKAKIMRELDKISKPAPKE